MFNITAAWKATATLLLILGLLGVTVYSLCAWPWLFVLVAPAILAVYVWWYLYNHFKK